MAHADPTTCVFQAFDALHVTSEFDVVVITQGNNTITLPSALVTDLLEALRLAAEGEI